jgi:rhodanese-related sulfurtransferase
MKLLIRNTLIIISSLLFGIVYNQLHPQGIHWRYLFHAPSVSQASIGIILADSAYVLLSDPRTLIIDTRAVEDFELDHLPGALNFHLENLVEKQEQFRTSDYSTVIFYDQEGKIEHLTFFVSPISFRTDSNIYILYGGFLAWLEKGYPVEEGVSDEI